MFYLALRKAHMKALLSGLDEVVENHLASQATQTKK